MKTFYRINGQLVETNGEYYSAEKFAADSCRELEHFFDAITDEYVTVEQNRDSVTVTYWDEYFETYNFNFFMNATGFLDLDWYDAEKFVWHNAEKFVEKIMQVTPTNNIFEIVSVFI